MTIRVLTYLLLLLMTLQSSAALADVHDAHQSGVEHLSFEDHDHEVQNDQIHNLLEASEDHGDDCHHCCHCHGQCSPAVIISSQSISLALNTCAKSNYSDNTCPEAYETFLRPPIA